MEAELKTLLEDQKSLQAKLVKLEDEWMEACGKFYDQKTEITKQIRDNEIERAIIMRTMTTPIT